MVTVTFPEYLYWLIVVLFALLTVVQAIRVYLWFLQRKVGKLKEFVITHNGVTRKARWID